MTLSDQFKSFVMSWFSKVLAVSLNNNNSKLTDLMNIMVAGAHLIEAAKPFDNLSNKHEASSYLGTTPSILAKPAVIYPLSTIR